MGHFWIRESHFTPKKASWLQNSMRPDYAPKFCAIKLCVTEFRAGSKFPAQQKTFPLSKGFPAQ